jgi:hypothetical protein
MTQTWRLQFEVVVVVVEVVIVVVVAESILDLPGLTTCFAMGGDSSPL